MSLAWAEKQIKLEDIERDNLINEHRTHQQSEGQQQNEQEQLQSVQHPASQLTASAYEVSECK